jgi:hypothetical protein
MDAGIPPVRSSHRAGKMHAMAAQYIGFLPSGDSERKALQLPLTIQRRMVLMCVRLPRRAGGISFAASTKVRSFSARKSIMIVSFRPLGFAGFKTGWLQLSQADHRSPRADWTLSCQAGAGQTYGQHQSRGDEFNGAVRELDERQVPPHNPPSRASRRHAEAGPARCTRMALFRSAL